MSCDASSITSSSALSGLSWNPYVSDVLRLGINLGQRAQYLSAVSRSTTPSMLPWDLHGGVGFSEPTATLLHYWLAGDEHVSPKRGPRTLPRDRASFERIRRSSKTKNSCIPARLSSL